MSGKTDFDETAFRKIYIEWERCAFLDELSFDILIPIIFVKFDFDFLELNDDVFLVKMPEEIQLARMESNSYGRSSAEELVTGCATHVLVFRYWVLSNTSWFQRANIFGSIETFSTVIEKVNNFFAALRVVTGIETGYSQLVIYPDNWGDRWKAHLPYVKVVSTRAYPDHFEDGGWRNDPSILSEQQCRDAFDIFTAVNESKSNKLTLACKRLNMAHLRRTEEDAILDITIALEALLADDSHGEITYRLAMRLGALGRIEPFEGHTPTEVVEMCKRIYAYRSSVVHGSHNVDKKRIIPVKSSPEPIPAVTLGLSLLRYAIKVLSQHLDLLQTKNLDEFLLAAQ